jgi:glycosyltransferase involved in cell wall biosynthesis
VIVSDRVGCGEDLVRPGWNGFVVGHADADGLARAIGGLVAADPAARATLGARGRTLVDGYSVEHCADGIVAACRRARPRERG